MAAISQMTFPNCISVNEKFYIAIGSGNGLAPHKQQTITWTNGDPDHWWAYAALKDII